ncbi:MAG: helix-turn-helix transcriptional regulator [Phycisphaerales bacterium]|jgi:ribosome-binding protein aMBF1 (putative translation factor)|nr:helix-turn-helix transcriptional regulator [Phycisphaerales bacterium]
MIRNETEYQEATKRIDEEKARLAQYTAAWREKGYGPDEIAALKEPMESFHLQLVEEVQSYERLKRGQIEEFENLHGLGQVLIGLRIARGMTQRELARRLGVDETMVSRDERNEYHGITVDRARRIVDAMGVRLMTRVEVEPLGMPGGQPAEPTPAG